jgi:hypothetical protein
MSRDEVKAASVPSPRRHRPGASDRRHDAMKKHRAARHRRRDAKGQRNDRRGATTHCDAIPLGHAQPRHRGVTQRLAALPPPRRAAPAKKVIACQNA